MASGHANRANRPNTWLHRPSCKRAENPCQRGAVHTWHISEVPRAANEVRLLARTGQVGLQWSWACLAAILTADMAGQITGVNDPCRITTPVPIGGSPA